MPPSGLPMPADVAAFAASNPDWAAPFAAGAMFLLAGLCVVLLRNRSTGCTEAADPRRAAAAPRSRLLRFFLPRRQPLPARPAPAVSTRPAAHRPVAGPARDPFDFGSAVEHRGAPRRRGRQVTVQIVLAAAPESPADGWVLDRSMGGLCLSAGREFAVGVVLGVRPADSPAGTPWVQVRVRSCQPEAGGRWAVGCQFAQTPSASVLLLFG
jgi:hypothetical protein